MKQRTRKLSELNLIDNFLFSVVMSHEVYGPRTAQIILSTIIGREVQIRKLHAEKVIFPPDTDRHGIRLDAYVEEEQTDVSQGDVFDVEPENKRNDKQLIPKRARYYHSRMDGRSLEAGKSYDKLPNTWVIFITSFDPFVEGRMVYTIRKRCIEVPDMEYDDGTTTLFLNVTGESTDASQDLKELLAYMRNTTHAKAVNSKLKEIQEGIDQIKTEPSVREAYMTLGDYIRAEREEAAEEAKAEAEKAKAEAAEAKAEVEKAKAEVEKAKADAKKAQVEMEEAKAEIEKLRAELRKNRESI